MIYDYRALLSVAMSLLFWAVLITCAGMPVAQLPWEDCTLPLDTVPIFYNTTLRPDIVNANYSGNINIDIALKVEKKFIWLNHIGHRIHNAVLIDSNMQPVPINSTFVNNCNFIVELTTNIKPGNYQLCLQYHGQIYRDLFPNDFIVYYNSGNMTRELAWKRFVGPCFCQRQLRAAFQTQIIHPSNDYQVLSNTKIERVLPGSPRVGMTTTVFKKSPITDSAITFVGSYLDNLPTKYTKQGIAVTLYGRSEIIEYCERNLEAAVFALGFYTKYLNFSLPIEKYDVITVPELDFGLISGFSSLGLAFFSEQTGTIERGVTTGYEEFLNVKTSVHEPGHTVFPWTVGTKWNSDKLLQEGCIVFLQYKAVAALYPEWKNIMHFAIWYHCHFALALDSTLSLIPLVPLIGTNDIRGSSYPVYDKGHAVFRMLECVVGSENMELGFKEYVTKFVYKSSDIDSLWDSIQLFSPKINVKRMMHTWTLQNTYPLLTVTRSNNKLIVTQWRYLDDKNTTYNSSESPFKYLWDIPVTGRGSHGFEITDTLWLTVENSTLVIDLPDNVQWVKLNLLECGYYRVNYDLQMWNQLAILLQEDMTALDGIDRGNLLNDAFSLAESDRIPFETALNLTKYMVQENEFLPLYAVMVDHFWTLQTIFFGTNFYEYYRRYFASLLSPHFRRFSLEYSPDMLPLERMQRSDMLSRACRLGVVSCLETTKRIFDKWLLHCGRKPVPEIARLVYNYGMQQGGQDQFYKLYDKYLNEADPAEKGLYRQALCQTRIPSLIQYLLYIFPDDDLVNLFDDCAGNPTAVPIMWTFVRINIKHFTQYFSDSLASIISMVTTNFAFDVELHEVEAFFGELTLKELGQEDRQIILNAIQSRVALREKQLVPLSKWFMNALQ